MAGYLAIWVPWGVAVLNGTTAGTNMVDGMQPVSLLFLTLIGLVGGMVIPQRCWIGGVFSMALFPVMAMWDMMRDPTSHNLFPIEFMIYAALTVPGVIAGFVGKSVVRFITRA